MNIVVIGSSGHAKTVVNCIEKEGQHEIIGFIDSFAPIGELIYGYPILGDENNLLSIINKYNIQGCIVGIGDNWQRHKMVKKIKSITNTLHFISTVHPRAELAKGCSIGQGTVIFSHVNIGSDVKIGNFCLINTGVIIEHDSCVGDYASLAPSVTTGGNTLVGDFSAIGLGCNLMHKVTIGKHCVLGIGSTLLSNISDFCIAYGSPAIIIKKRTVGEPYL